MYSIQSPFAIRLEILSKKSSTIIYVTTAIHSMLAKTITYVCRIDRNDNHSDSSIRDLLYSTDTILFFRDLYGTTQSNRI